MWVDARPDGAILSEQRFLVVGSFESPPVAIDKDKPGYAAYKAWEGRINENCAARDASTGWFTLGGDAASHGGRSAWDGARLIDGIVEQARTASIPPFSLDCDPSNDPEHIFCANARKSLAAIDPADLASIATHDFIHKGVDYLETVIDTQGDPYVELTVRQEAVLKPDRHGMSPFRPVITSVAIVRQWQPVTD